MLFFVWYSNDIYLYVKLHLYNQPNEYSETEEAHTYIRIHPSKPYAVCVGGNEC